MSRIVRIFIARRAGLAMLVALSSMIVAVSSASAASACGSHSWCNRGLAAGTRATLVLAEMSPAEKLELVSSDKEGIARLGIPPVSFIDGPNGIGEGTKGVTAFPDAETIAASWDPGVAAAYGRALGAEAAGTGNTLIAAPTINIVRTPKWGVKPRRWGRTRS